MANARQIAFVDAFLTHGDHARAQIEAGYSENAIGYGLRLLESPAVAAELEGRLAAMRREGAVVGYLALRSIAEKGKNEGARVTAARTLLEYAGLIGRQAGDAVKDPADMSTAELRQLLAKVDSEIASRAKPVNGPNASPIPQQVIDLLDE